MPLQGESTETSIVPCFNHYYCNITFDELTCQTEVRESTSNSVSTNPVNTELRGVFRNLSNIPDKAFGEK